MLNIQNVQRTGLGKSYRSSDSSGGAPNPDNFSTPGIRSQGGLNAQTNGTTPASPAVPTSQTNDILILMCFCQNTNTDFATPTDWNLISQINAGDHKVAFFWKRHDGSESSPSVTNAGWTSTNVLAAKIDAYSGCRTSGTPYEALDTNSSGSGALAGADVVTTGLKRLALQLWGRLANTASAPDAVWTESYDAGTSGGGGCRFYVDSREVIWPGTVPAASRGGTTVSYAMAGIALIGDGPDYTPPAVDFRQGLWVWDFITTVVGVANEENILLNECINTGITDLYCYTFASELVANATAIRAFIARCSILNIRVWGLDGAREYFSDLDGPQQLVDDLAAIITFNSASDPDEKFYGFHIDQEPADLGDGLAFHNGIAQSALSTVPASGVWQDTEALDREMLMRDWITTHQLLIGTCHDNGLKLSSALTTFLDDYFGEPVTCTFNGVTQNVFLHLASYIDTIALMSYSTNPSSVVQRITYELAQQNLSAEIGFALESMTGVGSGISYGDTVGKQSKAALNTDKNITKALFAGQPNFLWFNYHDWEGWKALDPASNDTSDPTA